MQENKVEAYCLRIPKTYGEKAIKSAADLGLLNRDLRIQLENEHLLIPLVQKPSPTHIAEFEKALPRFDVVLHVFSVRVKRAQELSEIVAEFLSPDLLARFPRAIDFVGDIAVIELPTELEPYKKRIGEAVLEAHKRARTVLAKSGAVSGTYRLREFELIAGIPDTETTHVEHSCKYRLDLSRAYFSPRLSHEHLRVASQVSEDETVVDMFAGVGPFAVLIAKMRRNVAVYAVDINPNAVEYLKKNVVLNKVEDKVTPILGDANVVIRERLRGKADRVIMNLPEKAHEHIAAACEAIKPEGGTIHYYEFAGEPGSLEAAKNRVAERVQQAGRAVVDFTSARRVREVAPFKWQIAIDAKIH